MQISKVYTKRWPKEWIRWPETGKGTGDERGEERWLEQKRIVRKRTRYGETIRIFKGRLTGKF